MYEKHFENSKNCAHFNLQQCQAFFSSTIRNQIDERGVDIRKKFPSHCRKAKFRIIFKAKFAKSMLEETLQVFSLKFEEIL